VFAQLRLSVIDFTGQCTGSRPDSGQRRDLVRIKLRTEFSAAFGQSCEALRGDGVELLALAGEFAQRLIDRAAHAGHLALAGLAKLVEPVEAVDQVFQLRMRGSASRGDVVGHVLGRAGDHRKLAAKALHVFECSLADGADRIDAGTVVADQLFETVGVLRQSLGRYPAQRFQIARLRGDELASKAQFAVHSGQPHLQLRGLGGQQPGGIAEARCFAAAAAHGEQPYDADEEHRHRPFGNERSPETGR